MGQFIARRVFLGIIALLLAMLIVFSLSRLKGDPRYFFIGEDSLGIDPAVWEEWGRKLNLDKPVPIQFALWMGDILTGDFGDSVTLQRPVLSAIREKAPNTIQLGIVAWLMGTFVGVPLGVFSAANRGNFLDYLFRGFALFGQSVPIFWLALVMIFVFAVHLGWLPSGTKGEGLAIRNFIMPAIALAWFPAASYLRITRTAMLEILDSEFIKFGACEGCCAGAGPLETCFPERDHSPVDSVSLRVVRIVKRHDHHRDRICVARFRPSSHRRALGNRFPAAGRVDDHLRICTSSHDS